MLVAFNKPHGVLCQFTDRSTPPRPTLAGFGLPPGVYPAGRLDHDSEGLLLLTDDGGLVHRVTDPRHRLAKTYLVQVAGDPSEEQLARLRAGVELRIGEGRNRQVRRMTAAVGLPTLRLVRTAIGAVALDALAPGQWRELAHSAPFS